VKLLINNSEKKLKIQDKNKFLHRIQSSEVNTIYNFSTFGQTPKATGPWTEELVHHMVCLFTSQLCWYQIRLLGNNDKCVWM